MLTPTPHTRVDDVRILDAQELTRPADLLEELPVTPAVADLVCETRRRISRILRGDDTRLVAIVGPCSIHHVDAAREYARRIAAMREQFSASLEIVMRVYFEKPRTRVGWKGLINDPYLDGTFRINDGLRLARRLLLEINGLGLPTATEYVDLITPQYLGDLISWAAIGARTSESQVHRELASGLSCPVGFKNGTTGDVDIAVNAVAAAQCPHHFLAITKSGAAAIVATTGNPDGHVILRGGPRPNFDERAIADVAAALTREGVCSRVMVDCSHGNCGGDYRRQLTVATEIAHQLDAGSPHICGVMVESNLVAGRQAVTASHPLIPGQSITDPCLDLDDTELLLSGFARQRAGVELQRG
jgi:3-deoxy-7-phosphoheptulonate synthase